IVLYYMSAGCQNNYASFFYTLVPRAGTDIVAVIFGYFLHSRYVGTPTHRDPSKFVYLGNANVEVFICIARADAPAKTFPDTLTQELIVGATNEGGSTRDFTAMLNNVLGTKLRIVTGYAGSNEIMLA